MMAVPNASKCTLRCFNVLLLGTTCCSHNAKPPKPKELCPKILAPESPKAQTNKIIQNKKINKNQDRRLQAGKMSTCHRSSGFGSFCSYMHLSCLSHDAKPSLSNTTKDQDYIASKPTTWPQGMHYLALSCNLLSRANDTTDRASDLLSHFAGTNLAFDPSSQAIPYKTIQSQPRVAILNLTESWENPPTQ